MMKKVLLVAAAIAFAADGAALAQNTIELQASKSSSPADDIPLESVGATDIPIEQSEGFGDAQALNARIADANNAAAAREAAAQQAYQQAEAKRQAEIAAAEARQREIDAEFARQQADYNAKNAAWKADVEAAQRAEAAYKAAQADYQACVAGDRSRCRY